MADQDTDTDFLPGQSIDQNVDNYDHYQDQPPLPTVDPQTVSKDDDEEDYTADDAANDLSVSTQGDDDVAGYAVSDDDDETLVPRGDDFTPGATAQKSFAGASSGAHPHSFVGKYFARPTWCSHCVDFIWGVSAKQQAGWFCKDCKATVHHNCRDQIGPCITDKFGGSKNLKGSHVANKRTWAAGTEKSGWLKKKKGQTGDIWTRYWFVLQGNQFFYYTSASRDRHQGVIDLFAVTTCDPLDAGRFAMQVQTPGMVKPVYLRAEDIRERDEWVAAIKKMLASLSSSDGSGGVVGYTLRCTAKNLERMAAGGLVKSDPFLAIYPFTGNHYKGFRGYNKLIWRSEVIRSAKGASWEPITLFYDHCGGPKNFLIIEAWDYRENGNHQLIGQFAATLEELIDPTKRWFFVNPRKKSPFYKHSGKFFVTSFEPISPKIPDPLTGCTYEIIFSAQNLEFKDINLQSDPFLVVKGTPITVTGNQAAGADLTKNMTIIAKTEVVHKMTSGLSWKPVKLDLRLTGGVFGVLIIEVYNYNKSGRHDYIGAVRTSLHTLLMSSPRFPIINEGKKGYVGYRNSGTLFVVKNLPNFLPPDPDPIRFTFECGARDLDRKDLSGTSDPYFVIMARPYPTVSKPYHPNLQRELDDFPRETDRVPVYKSEVVKHNLKPAWKAFDLNVSDFGGYDNPIAVQVFDHERSGQHNYIGEFRTTLREILMPGNTFRIAHPKKTYTAIFPNSGLFEFQRIAAIPPVDSTPPIAFKVEFKAEKVEKADLLGFVKSDPFITIVARPYLAPSAIRVHRSEVVLNSRNPEWKPFVMEVPKYGGMDSIIKFEIWDQDPKERADFIGEFKTTLRELSYYKSNPCFAFVNRRKKGQIGYKHSGMLFVINCLPVYPPKEHKPQVETFQSVTFQGASAPTLAALATVAPGVPMGAPVGAPVAGVPVGAPLATGVPTGAPVAAGVPMGAPVGTPVPMGAPVGTPVGGVPMGAPVNTPVGGVPMGAPVGTPVGGVPMGAPVGTPAGGVPMGAPGGVPMGALGVPMGAPGGVQGGIMRSQSVMPSSSGPFTSPLARANSVPVPTMGHMNHMGQQPMMTNQMQMGQQPMMNNQMGQQPMMANQMGQQPMMTNQMGQQPMMANQMGQQPMMNKPMQMGQQPMMANQMGQQPMMNNQMQMGQQPMMNNQMQMGQQPMMTNQMGQPMMANQMGQQSMMTNQARPMQGQMMGQQPMMGNQQMMGQPQMQTQMGMNQQPMMTNQGMMQPMQGQMMGQQPMGQQPMMGNQQMMANQGMMQPMQGQMMGQQMMGRGQPMMTNQGMMQPMQGQMMGQQMMGRGQPMMTNQGMMQPTQY